MPSKGSIQTTKKNLPILFSVSKSPKYQVARGKNLMVEKLDMVIFGAKSA